MDIMRHGAQVEVIAPDSLRDAVRQRLTAAAAQYPD
jgi:predicted DNA-binding transcriptional regulator YafY